MNLIIDPSALDDLDHVFNWYESRQTGLGKRFYEEFKETLSLISKFPEAFEIKESLHAAVMQNFPYHVFYALAKDDVVVLAVFGFRQDMKKLKTGKLK